MTTPTPVRASRNWRFLSVLVGIVMLIILAILTTSVVIGLPKDSTLNLLSWPTILLFAVLAYGGWSDRSSKPTAAVKFFRWCTGLLVLAALMVSYWPESQIRDIALQKAISRETNRPTVMGVLTYSGDFHVDPEGRTPEECVPTGYTLADSHRAVIKDGTGTTKEIPFDKLPFDLYEGCFMNGKRLVPIPANQIPDIYRGTPQGFIDLVTESDAEREEIVAHAEAKRLEALRRLEAERAAREATHLKKPKTIVTFGPCTDPRFVDSAIGFCGLASFEAGDIVQFQSSGMCPYVAQRGFLDGPSRKPGGVASFEAMVAGTATIFSIKKGHSFRGSPCK